MSVCRGQKANREVPRPGARSRIHCVGKPVVQKPDVGNPRRARSGSRNIPMNLRPFVRRDLWLQSRGILVRYGTGSGRRSMQKVLAGNGLAIRLQQRADTSTAKSIIPVVRVSPIELRGSCWLVLYPRVLSLTICARTRSASIPITLNPLPAKNTSHGGKGTRTPSGLTANAATHMPSTVSSMRGAIASAVSAHDVVRRDATANSVDHESTFA